VLAEGTTEGSPVCLREAADLTLRQEQQNRRNQERGPQGTGGVPLGVLALQSATRRPELGQHRQLQSMHDRMAGQGACARELQRLGGEGGAEIRTAAAAAAALHSHGYYPSQPQQQTSDTGVHVPYTHRDFPVPVTMAPL
jgi:hypothetical protein